jgi:hypothetical protein
MNGNELGDGLPMLGDNNALRADMVQQSQALLLEFGGGNALMEKDSVSQKACLVTKSGTFFKRER